MFIILRLFADVIAIIFSCISAYLINFHTFNLEGFLYFPFQQYQNYLIVITLIYLFSLYFLGMYKPRKGFFLYIDELVGSFGAITIAWGILIIFTFLRGEYVYSRPTLIISWPITYFSMLFLRELLLRFELLAKSKGYGSRRAAIIGTGDLASSLAERIKNHPSYGVSFVGFIGDKGEPLLGSIDALDGIIEKHRIEFLFIADKNLSRDKLTEFATYCEQKGIALGSIPDVFEILTTSPSVEDIDGFPMVSLNPTRLTTINRFIKRTFDIFLSLFGIIIFAIPMAIIAVIIKITSPGGPAIYKQVRIGKRGEEFNLLKFRTMIPNAEKETGPVLASEDDPRKTPFGHFLRRTNLDELPQLFNIFKGDMSFVGPRPERPIFVDEFKNLIPKYMERHKIRPGLAGWAQLHGGYFMPAEEKIKYDLYYVENWSFLLDVKIILKYLQIAFTLQRRN